MISNTHSAPLSATEFDILNDFLISRGFEAAQPDCPDEGILDGFILHGFLTAVVSSPVLIPRSRWWASIWGDYPHDWSSEPDQMIDDSRPPPDRATIEDLIHRMKEEVSSTLTHTPNQFTPRFDGQLAKRQIPRHAESWCSGYRRGIRLTQQRWVSDEGLVNVLLRPILAFTAATGYSVDALSATEQQALFERIAPNVRTIHAYWLTRREPARAISLKRARAYRQGRNEACSCGSGKKYKRCCLRARVRDSVS